MPLIKKKKKLNSKRKKKLSPILKKLFLKKDKLMRFKNNYGANLVEQPKYSFYPSSPEELDEKSSTVNQDILKDADKSFKKAKSKKGLNLLYFFLNLLVIGIVLWVQLAQEGDPGSSILAILDINWWFVLAGLGTFFVGMLLDQIRFSCLIYKATGVYRGHLAYKLSAIGRHYDVITPLGSGGQPFQVLYTNKYGIKAGEGISIVMAKYIFYQIIFFLFATFFLLRGLATNVLGNVGGVAEGLATTLSWIGYFVLSIVIITITLISFNKRIGAGLVVGVLKLLSKIKIGKFRLIKDYKSSFSKVMRTVNVWQSTTRKYSKSGWIIAVNVFCSIAYFLVAYSMPFFIYCAFEGWNPDAFLTIVTLAVMVDLSSAFNPIPLGIGTADLSFTAFFAAMILTSGAQFWALIIWRILFYYIYVLQGFFVLTYDYLIGDKRLRKNKEMWTMPLKQRLQYKKEQEKFNQE